MEYKYEEMHRYTYGFDLTPLIFIAWSTGDKKWLRQLHRRYMRDRLIFPKAYERKGKINYLEG